MRGAGSKIHEKRLIPGEQSLLTDPCNRAVGHVLHEMLAFLGRLRRLHDFRALVNRGIPLVGLPRDKTVEVFETGARRPAIERPDRTRFPHRDLVALAELRGRVAVEPKNLRQRRHRVGPYGTVTWSRGRDFRDTAHRHRMMITPA